ncbi:MAG: hypothetical protein GXY61_00520 [Lentisphaerae bacterium]|nr:hypothetical protein [Lentisphaerota bacterium]
MIHLDHSMIINEGATRRCYRHPDDPGKCLKIEKRPGAANANELQAYRAVQNLLSDYLAECEPELAVTSEGEALVCELVRDADGTISPSFSEFLLTEKTDENLRRQFLEFFDLIVRHKLCFYDFNPKNFVIQHAEDGFQLKYTDLKSFHKTKTAFALEKIPFFATLKLKRRSTRFIKRYLNQTPSSAQ